MDKLLKMIIKSQADLWLKDNTHLLNSQEKQKFLIGLNDYLEDKDIVLDDEVFDFLVEKKLIKNEPRETTFINYLKKKYGSLKDFRILDVGAGRICSLSKALTEQGGKVTAMDTNIRISDSMLKKSKITGVKKLFRCDEFSKNGIGTSVDNYNLIVGLEPCGATEHIIRQALKYDKPFDVSLCAAPHNGLNSEVFKSYMEWYEHLKKIPNEISIIRNDCGYVATNN